MASLTARDIENLQGRWIPPELAAAAGLFRVDSARGAALVGRNGGRGDYSGIAIPYRHLTAEAGIREYRLRRDHPDLEQKPDGSTRERAKYLSPPGRGSMLYLPFDIKTLTDPSIPIVLTEGELKCLSLSRLAHWDRGADLGPRFLAVGLAGVWNWRGSIGKASDAEGHRQAIKGPIPDLNLVAWKGGRIVWIVFDSDAAKNLQVAAARRALAGELTGRGADVRIVELPDLAGLGKTGVDDFLAHPNGGPEQLLRLLETAPRSRPLSIAEILEASGLMTLPKGCAMDSVEEALRRLAVECKGLDALRCVGIQEAAISRLKDVGLRAPAAIVRTALGAAQEKSEKNDLPTVEPWAEPVDGAELLEDIAAVIQRYCIIDLEPTHAVALWAAFTHCVEAADTAPLLIITSPEKRCGKTRLGIDLLGELVHRPLPASNISPAALFRAVEKYQPTLLIDEADSFAKDNEELRGIINSGHRRSSAFVVRTVGDDHEPRKFSTWGPKLLCAIGSLADTLSDRAVIIQMRRRAPGEKISRWKQARAAAELLPLHRKVARWAKDHVETLRGEEPETPAGLNDRAADNWTPLLAIADLAGGPWPGRARRAALTLSGEGVQDEQSSRVVLLQDIQEIFDTQRADRIASDLLVKDLISREDRPWIEWRHGKALTTRGLARLLKPFGVTPGIWRDGLSVVRGYRQESFREAWERYAPPSESLQRYNPLESTTCRKVESLQENLDFSNRYTANGNQSNNYGDCNVVTIQKGRAEGVTPFQSVWPPIPEGTHLVDVDVEGDE